MLTYMRTPPKPTYHAELDDTAENRARIAARIQAKEGLYTFWPRRGKVGVGGPRESLTTLLEECGGGCLYILAG